MNKRKRSTFKRSGKGSQKWIDGTINNKCPCRSCKGTLIHA